VVVWLSGNGLPPIDQQVTLCQVNTWMSDCLRAGTSRYVTSHLVNSAFSPSGVGKPTTGQRAGVRRGAFTCVKFAVQTYRGSARWCPSVPTAVYISRRHPDPTKTPVFHLGWFVRSCCQTAYCWTSCFLCRSCLERSSCRRHFSTFSVHFRRTFKIASLSTFLSWPCPL